MADKGLMEKLADRYYRAAHRVQSAIAFNPNRPSDAYKDLRTGINLSKSDQAGLAALLIKKGIITQEEYSLAMTEAAEEEAKRGEDELSSLYGINVKSL